MHPSLEAALKSLLEENPNLKQLSFKEAWKTVNEKLSQKFKQLIEFFAPDEEQISKFLGIPLPELFEVLIAPTEEEEDRFVGTRKIKLASPASS